MPVNKGCLLERRVKPIKISLSFYLFRIFYALHPFRGFSLQLFCCSKRRASQSQYKYDSKQHHAMHIIHVDAGGAKVNQDHEKKNTNKNKDDELQEKDGAGDYKRNCSDGCHKNDGLDGLQDERNNNKSNNETGNNFKEVAKESHVNVFQVI